MKRRGSYKSCKTYFKELLEGTEMDSTGDGLKSKATAEDGEEFDMLDLEIAELKMGKSLGVNELMGEW